MAMEEFDEFEVLWPDACHAQALHEPPPSCASPSMPAQAQVQVQRPDQSSTLRPKQRWCSTRSRPVDVPSPKSARRHRLDGKVDGDDADDAVDDSDAIVPPHLLVSGRRWSEAETAWALRASGPPCKRARELCHLRDSVLRMTGFIEG